MSHKFFFFYGDMQVDVGEETLTGLQIKQAIHAKVPTADLSHELVLEGQGHHADEVIADDHSVDLAIGHGEGPKRFFLRPPTNFGHG